MIVWACNVVSMSGGYAVESCDGVADAIGWTEIESSLICFWSKSFELYAKGRRLSGNETFNGVVVLARPDSGIFYSYPCINGCLAGRHFMNVALRVPEIERAYCSLPSLVDHPSDWETGHDRLMQSMIGALRATVNREPVRAELAALSSFAKNGIWAMQYDDEETSVRIDG